MGIQTDLKNNKISNIYLIYGEESYKRKILKDALTANIPYNDSMNYAYYEGKDINFSDVYDNAVTLPFFADYRLVIVENSGLFKAKKKSQNSSDAKEGSEKKNKEEDAASNTNQSEEDEEKQNEAEKLVLKIFEDMPKTTVIAFVEESAAKNKKIYKQAAKSGCVEECTKDNASQISKWAEKGFAQAGKKAEPAAINLLIERVGADYIKLREEIEKLISYAGNNDTITSADVCAISSIDIETKVFYMLNKMGEKDLPGALEKYYELLSTKEPPLKILAMIRKHFQTMLEAAELGNKKMTPEEIEELTGTKKFAVRNAMGYMKKNYKMKEVCEILYLINETDMKMKNGELSSPAGLETLIVKITLH